MNEAYFNGKIRDAVKLNLRGAVWFKTNDRATAGIPDLAITWAGITSWIEDKYWRKRDTLKKVIHEPLQVQTVRSLGARAAFVIFRESPKGTGIFTADQVQAALDGVKELEFSPGFDYSLVIRWLRQNSLFNCDRTIK